MHVYGNTLYLAGFLEDRRAGLWVYYRISPSLDDDHEAMLASLSKILVKRERAHARTKADQARSSDPGRPVSRTPCGPRAAAGRRK